MDPDAQLLEAWRGGDRRAGAQLLDRRAREITWFFRNKVFDEADVPDLVSQTFLGCVSARDRFAGDTSFRRFVYSIAHNVLREYLRTKAKRRREQIDFAQVCVHEIDPRSPSSMEMRRRELRAFVEGLRRVSLEHQVVLELKYFEALKGREIAERLGLPEGTVKTRLRRGLEHLRERVGQQLRVGGPEVPEVMVEELEAWAAQVRAMRES
ncbi:MAG: RNA polymerase sigma factor [Myxococcales bacterium]|nr:RNA polymerase sigma factor [Myxococcales bacterium]MCB9719120.1 RNA polymerase sigma factor [Myxococcales bacterium]